KPRDVMKLAIYFRASPTISHLGEVLWEKGRKSITMDQSVAQVVKQFFGLDIILFNKAFDDAIEDQFDPDPEENPEPPFPFDFEFLFARVSGIGMLFERRVLEEGEVAFFVDGICRAPDELPNPEDSATTPSN